MAAPESHRNEPECRAVGSRAFYHVGVRHIRPDGFQANRFIFRKEWTVLDINRVFVYGTLLSGMSNHNRYCGDALTIEPAVTTGRLYHLPYGFPAMFDTPDGQVFGEVITFPDIVKSLERLDVLEGYSPSGASHYVRVIKHVKVLKDCCIVPAWVYVYPKHKSRATFSSVSSGRWVDFLLRS